MRFLGVFVLGMLCWLNASQLLRFPDYIVAGYVCQDESITLQQILDAGFNMVTFGFFTMEVIDNEVEIMPNTCCGSQKPYELAQQLVQNNIVVMASVGGYGCQSLPPQDIQKVDKTAIVAAFQDFIATTGVQWSGLDFDWEAASGQQVPQAINHIGQALKSVGYYITCLPTSQQFNPGGLSGWTSLNPAYVDAVLVQWYDSSCAQINSCPCWGRDWRIDDMPTCQYFNKTYMAQSTQCSVVQWLAGFGMVGNYSWNANQIVIGTPADCTPPKCTQNDTGIWSGQQMQKILKESKILGTFIWDISNYLNQSNFQYLNPVNHVCNWTNQVISSYNSSYTFNASGLVPSNCTEYIGAIPSICEQQPQFS